MSLKQWLDNGWLRRHQSSAKEITDLLAITERDLKDAEYLDSCRSKRNIVEYDYVGAATAQDADELIEFVVEMEKDVRKWLKEHRP